MTKILGPVLLWHGLHWNTSYMSNVLCKLLSHMGGEQLNGSATNYIKIYYILLPQMEPKDYSCYIYCIESMDFLLLSTPKKVYTLSYEYSKEMIPWDPKLIGTNDWPQVRYCLSTLQIKSVYFLLELSVCHVCRCMLARRQDHPDPPAPDWNNFPVVRDVELVERSLLYMSTTDLPMTLLTNY